jgi:hypothetical protein
MSNQIKGLAIDLNVSADFLQYIGRWDYNPMTNEGKMYQQVTADIDESGNVKIYGEEPNLAAVNKIRELSNQSANAE